MIKPKSFDDRPVVENPSQLIFPQIKTYVKEQILNWDFRTNLGIPKGADKGNIFELV